ncbi:MAG: endonuclease III [Nanoarchaeota archaeon]|nr:endonuclease III [Nanoarchaeota archaeon]
MVSREIALKQLRELKKRGRKMRLAADGWKNNWQTLIAIILSARTRDETTIKVCEKMFTKSPTPQKFSKLDEKQVKELIYSVNFANNKSKNILKCTKQILEEHKGKTPEKFEELVELAGVGRKTANVYLAELGKQEIGVDTHVTYISNYLDWAHSRKQEEIEKSLKKLFPKKRHKDLNWILVQFGKTHTSKRHKDEVLDEIKRVK